MSGRGPADFFGRDGSGSAGQQAQFNQLIQAVNRIGDFLTGQATSAIFVPHIFTGAGNLDIASQFPGLTSGTFPIQQVTPAALNVTLPGSVGPWIVGDGAGVATADNITVLPPAGSGYTINGAANNVISTNWQFRIYLLVGTNYVVLSLS